MKRREMLKRSICLIGVGSVITGVESAGAVRGVRSEAAVVPTPAECEAAHWRRITAKRKAFEKFCVERAEPYIAEKTGCPTWSAYDRMQHNTMIIGWSRGSFDHIDHQCIAIDMREWEKNAVAPYDAMCIIEIRLKDTLNYPEERRND